MTRETSTAPTGTALVVRTVMPPLTVQQTLQPVVRQPAPRVLIDWTKPENNPACVYLKRVGQSSRRGIESSLDTLAAMLPPAGMTAKTCPWHLLQYKHTVALRAMLGDKYPVHTTANRHLSVLKGVIKEAWQLGLMDQADYAIAQKLERFKGLRVPHGRHLEKVELEKLFATCLRDNHASGIRDAALFALLYGGGLRRAEAGSALLSNYNAMTGYLKVMGKGKKERYTHLTGFYKRLVDRWIVRRGSEPGTLLCSTTQIGNITHRPLSGEVILGRLVLRAEQAGIEKCRPHDLRRTCIGNAMGNNVDIATVQQMAGHSSIATTALYNRRKEEVKREGFATLDDLEVEGDIR